MCVHIRTLNDWVRMRGIVPDCAAFVYCKVLTALFLLYTRNIYIHAEARVYFTWKLFSSMYTVFQGCYGKVIAVIFWGMTCLMSSGAFPAKRQWKHFRNTLTFPQRADTAAHTRLKPMHLLKHINRLMASLFL